MKPGAKTTTATLRDWSWASVYMRVCLDTFPNWQTREWYDMIVSLFDGTHDAK